jgi:hypothetical protein
MLMTQVLADAYHCEASIEDGEALMAAALAAAAAVGATSLVKRRSAAPRPDGSRVSG